MAALGDLLQRIARSLEEASAQQPGDDLRARLGYGTGDDDEDEPVWDAVPEPETAEPGTARAPRTAWEPETTWRPEASRAPAPAAAASRTSGTHQAPPPGDVFGDSSSSRAVPSSHHASAASLLSERIRTRLHTPDALREAFVMKEILDRPLGRRGRQEGRGKQEGRGR